ncbi:MAG: hypothetical protein O3A46_05560 [Candidatus Poribacteria bacterium]|nr:hypothetical protein [Candidatus Poribacteria bacterium]
MERRFGAVPVGLFVAPGVDGERGTVIASLRVSRHAPELNIAKYRRRFDEFVEEWWLEHIHESDIELTVDML